jgi:diguanylate cyclase (GGDEF)-like protein/PAS domain S-box-containing protein
MTVIDFRAPGEEPRRASGQARREPAPHESERRFSEMFRLTPEPMALVRVSDGLVLEVNRSCAVSFGYEPDEMRGRSTLPHDLALWAEPRDREICLALLQKQGELIEHAVTLRRRDGSTGAFSMSGRHVELHGERCVVCTLRDVSERKQREDELSRIAYYDALTRLPNRVLLQDRLRQAIAQSRRSGAHLAVCYLDLDGFKEANDRFGHPAGDQILVEVACRLQAAVRGGDTVARLGGDEFVLVLCGLNSDQECLKALERVLRTIAIPYRVNDRQQALVSASIGVTVYPNDSSDADTLVRHADLAMYAAKLAGRNRFHFFDQPLKERIEARRSMRERIEGAIAAGEFVLLYQPTVDLRDGRIRGVDAAVRWRHPTLGLLLPGEFLPTIEDDPLMLSLGRRVVRDALEQIARWQDAGIDLPVSVNAFARYLLSPAFPEELQGLIRETRAAPERLTLQFPAAVTNEARALLKTFEDCQALGVGLALGELGRGSLSLSGLCRFPLREISIDARIVRDMLSETDAAAVVEAAIALGQAFRVQVLADGADSGAHVARLVELGCVAGQGAAVGAPMEAADLERWIGAR